MSGNCRVDGSGGRTSCAPAEVAAQIVARMIAHRMTPPGARLSMMSAIRARSERWLARRPGQARPRPGVRAPRHAAAIEAATRARRHPRPSVDDLGAAFGFHPGKGILHLLEPLGGMAFPLLDLADDP